MGNDRRGVFDRLPVGCWDNQHPNTDKMDREIMRTIIAWLGELFGRIGAHIFKAWLADNRKHKGEVKQIGNNEKLNEKVDDLLRDGLSRNGVRPKD